MKTKYYPRFTVILIACLLALSCSPFSGQGTAPTAVQSPATDTVDTPAPAASPTDAPTSIPSTATVEPTAASTLTPTPAPTPTELPIDTSIAYVQNDTLTISHINAGQVVDTQTYTKSDFRGGIFEVGWSPSGRYLAFSMYSQSFTHLFLLDALNGGDAVDLGIANDFAWSPDGKLLAYEHEYELWVYNTETGQPRQLTIHLGIDWTWYKPTFTPAGDALVAAGVNFDTMDRNGNATYKLYRVPLDGSATGAYPPGNIPALTPDITGRLPLALNFSPDGQHLALIRSEFFTTCAILSSYNIANADAADLQELPVPSLGAFGGPDEKQYFFGDSLVWTPESDGLWVNALVRDCGPIFDVVGGPQISRLTLDGQEHEIIPGNYTHLSLDHTGSLLAVVNQDSLPRVQILGRDGHLVLDLGEGTSPAFLP